ncbi:MAG: diaminopimelate epimerase [Vicingaceae bacterium]
MIIPFYKYQGTGNDFVVIDNRNSFFPKNDLQLIQFLCTRKKGIGSDGLILIENHSKADFNMIFYNPDGSKSFCGNGSRCAVHFAKYLQLFDGNSCYFESNDGFHHATIDGDLVKLKMHDVDAIEKGDDYYFIHTGSPHYIIETENLDGLDIIENAHKIRYNERFKAEGTNVNFIAIEDKNNVKIRTYERGVEDETLSCGTGVTAVALSVADKLKLETSPITVHAKGGILKVYFEPTNNGFKNIWLEGLAKRVFKGEIEV